MFLHLKTQVTENFNKLIKNQRNLFCVEVDREKIWELYLNGFTEDVRQSHTCNCCKSFLRQFAGIVTIENNVVKTMWDLKMDNIDDEYKNSVIAIRDYIKSLPVADVYYGPVAKLGTDKSYDPKTQITWRHFFVELPSQYVHRGSTSVESVQAVFRDARNVFKRSLDELTMDACDSILELIDQNSLYRGKEFEGLIKAFRDLKIKYELVPDVEKENFTWIESLSLSAALTGIRNSAIGKLLTDISEGIDLDRAVESFERMVAPSNYKRPTAVITSKMIADARQKLIDLGLVDSLERRFANVADVNINNLLFADRSSEIKDVFFDMGKETVVNPRSLTKVEEITIEDFITKVLPKSKSVSVLFENNHLNNLVSLITSNDKDAAHLFKWNNNFSWAYTGGITDSIKEKVKQAGGRVDGELRVSLSWYNYDDLDLHVIEPNGNKIYFSNKVSRTSGQLDVDMNAGSGTTRTPVENIIWNNKDRMEEGRYQVIVNNFSLREKTNEGYIVEIECNGSIYNFEYAKSPGDKKDHAVVSFNYSKKGGIVFDKEIKSNTVQKEKWNIKTNQFHKAKVIMHSPNHWDGATGNKHYMFMLDDCINDEAARPIFNEYLKDDLLKERKVFEVLGSKLKVEKTENQLSGLGFSETKRGDHLIVNVQGTVQRNLKIIF